jgi:hypothetical protein
MSLGYWSTFAGEKIPLMGKENACEQKAEAREAGRRHTGGTGQ